MSRRLFAIIPADIPPPVRGALWMVFSACSFAGVSVAVHSLAGRIHPFEIAFFRTLFLLLFMSPLLLRSGWSVLRTRNWRMHLFRCLASVAAMMSWFSALSLMPIAEVTALTFTAPLFSTLGAGLLLGERVGVRRWGAVLIGFAGTLIILRPGVEALAPGAWVALLAALFMAIIPLSVKVLSRTDPPTTAVLPFDFSRLIFVAAGGFLMFGEVLDLWTAAGAIIIFSATLYTARREARLARRLNPPPPDR